MAWYGGRGYWSGREKVFCTAAQVVDWAVVLELQECSSCLAFTPRVIFVASCCSSATAVGDREVVVR